MIRYRMKKIIKLLEVDNYKAVRELIKKKSYMTAFKALSKADIIYVLYADDQIGDFCLDEEASALYSLTRYDIWVNRIGGFIAGVVTALIPVIITKP